jgi:hypothetical protein
MWIYFPISSLTSVKSNLKKLIWTFRHVKLVVTFVCGVSKKVWGQHNIHGWLNCQKYILVIVHYIQFVQFWHFRKTYLQNVRLLSPPCQSVSLPVCPSVCNSLRKRQHLVINFDIGSCAEICPQSPNMLVTLLDTYSGGDRFETRSEHWPP